MAVELRADEKEKLAAIDAEAATLVEGDDFRAIDDRMRILHKEWMAIVDVLPRQAAERHTFQAARNRLKERRDEQRAQRDAKRQQQSQQAQAVVEQLEALATSVADQPKQAREGAKELQTQWRSVNKSADSAVRARWQQARAAIDAAPQGHYQALDWERFQRLPEAEAIITEVTALDREQDPEALHQSVKELQER